MPLPTSPIFSPGFAVLLPAPSLYFLVLAVPLLASSFSFLGFAVLLPASPIFSSGFVVPARLAYF